MSYELLTINRSQGADHTLALSDCSCIVEFAGAQQLIIPANATVSLPIGFNCLVSSLLGTVTLAPAAGVGLISPSGVHIAQNQMIQLIKRDTDSWFASGPLS